MASVRLLSKVAIDPALVVEDANCPIFPPNSRVEGIEVSFDGGGTWHKWDEFQLEEWLDENNLELYHTGNVIHNSIPGWHSHYLMSRRYRPSV